MEAEIIEFKPRTDGLYKIIKVINPYGFVLTGGVKASGSPVGAPMNIFVSEDSSEGIENILNEHTPIGANAVSVGEPLELIQDGVSGEALPVQYFNLYSVNKSPG